MYERRIIATLLILMNVGISYSQHDTTIVGSTDYSGQILIDKEGTCEYSE